MILPYVQLFMKIVRNEMAVASPYTQFLQMVPFIWSHVTDATMYPC